MGKSKSRHKARAGKSQPSGEVRIIAGRWRGRKLAVVDAPGLRPTGDRVRETLFNWLTPYLRGNVCVDLFAGSGALGFEAASRGAQAVRVVELNPRAVGQLRANAAMLEADLEIVHGDGFEQMALARDAGIVFVDPPFSGTDYPTLLEQLRSYVRKDALIYLESPTAATVPIPPTFELLREKRFGDVMARLIRVQ